jgi:hypothetical protein
LILLAKSEIRTIYVRHEPKNPGCQGANSHETDFASSIIFGDEEHSPNMANTSWVIVAFGEGDRNV